MNEEVHPALAGPPKVEEPSLTRRIQPQRRDQSPYHAEVSQPLTPDRAEFWPLATLILANLLPIVGVFLWGWDLTDLLMLYWIENAVIGAYTVLTLLVAWREGPSLGARIATKLFIVPFFLFHYGMFWFVHGVFLMGFFGLGPRLLDGGPQSFLLAPMQDVLTRADALMWPLIAIAVSHGVDFVTNFLVSGEFRRVPEPELMGRPYGRVVVLHVSIVVGGFLALYLGPSQGVLVMFVIVKIVADVMGHLRSQRRVRVAPAVEVTAA